MSRSGSGAPTARGRKKSFALRDPVMGRNVAAAGYRSV
jgi:hypothetical protein